VRRPLAAAIFAPLVALAACGDWRDRVEPGRAAAEPVQSLVAAPEIALEARGFDVRLTPRAEYHITGYAVETSRALLDEWDFVVPMDLALAWGPVADPAVLRRLAFHLSRRYVSYRWSGPPPLPAGVLESHVANQHLIPADAAVAEALGGVRVGDLVTLTGKLVDVRIADRNGRERARMRTSLSRDDTGSGACEVVWVEGVEVAR
jgi:hypothetical protein